jgi:hypothetical protein
MVDLDPTTTHGSNVVTLATETEETEAITIDPVHGGIIWCDESDGTILLRDSEINSNAAFFVTPKLDRDMVDRELRAIDLEYRNRITNDAIS